MTTKILADITKQAYKDFVEDILDLEYFCRIQLEQQRISDALFFLPIAQQICHSFMNFESQTNLVLKITSENWSRLIATNPMKLVQGLVEISSVSFDKYLSWLRNDPSRTWSNLLPEDGSVHENVSKGCVLLASLVQEEIMRASQKLISISSGAGVISAAR
mgnify:CR=1 FL=1